MQQMYGSIAALPTRTNINPTDPQSNEYWEVDSDIAYVLRDGRSLRVLKGYAHDQTRPEAGWGLGTVHHLHHDQAGYHLGTYTVVGWFTAQTFEGELPTRKLPLSVFK